MLWRSNAGCPHVDLSRSGLCIGDELGNRSGGYLLVHLHDGWSLADAGDECNVADKIIIEVFVERRIDTVDCGELHDCVAVRLSSCDHLGRDIARSPGAVLHSELLVQSL